MNKNLSKQICQFKDNYNQLINTIFLNNFAKLSEIINTKLRMMYNSQDNFN